MIKLSAAEIIQATGGAALGLQDPETVFCTFATTDSREVVPGTLFYCETGRKYRRAPFCCRGF